MQERWKDGEFWFAGSARMGHIPPRIRWRPFDKDEVYFQVREYSAKSPDGPRFMQWCLESCTWSLSPAPGFVNTFCPYLAGLISGH